MSLVISALHFDWSGYDNCFAKATGELGLDGVELSLGEPIGDACYAPEALDYLRSSAEQHGAILSAHLWDDYAALPTDTAIERLRYWLTLAKRAGMHALILHGGSYPQQRPGLSRFKQVLEAVVKDAEKAGVTLLLENHYPYSYRDCRELCSEPWEFLTIFHEISSPALRVCFDTGHAHMAHKTREIITELAPYIAYLHLADSAGEHDDHFGFGKGTVEWETIFSLLHTIQFAGDFCIEFPLPKYPEEFEHCRSAVREYQKKQVFKIGN